MGNINIKTRKGEIHNENNIVGLGRGITEAGEKI